MNGLRSLTSRYSFVFHPILFALFPLVSFYGANAKEVQTEDNQFLTFLFFNLAVVAACWTISFLTTFDAKKASVLTLMPLFIFFTLGRAHNVISDFAVHTPFGIIGPLKLLALVSTVLLIGAWLLVHRIQTDESLSKANTTLAMVGVVMLVVAALPALPTLFSSSSVSEQNQIDTTELEADQNQPDVYYILLDGYARGDFLKQNFGYDNSEFLSGLKEKGFYVAEQANTNYAHTHLSVPSTFNMKYLNYLADELGPESNDRAPLKDLTQNNEVINRFKAMGYKYVQIGSQWGWTMKSPHADVEIQNKAEQDSKILNIELDEFALVYLQTTALKPWVSTDIRGTLLARILGSFERTEEAVGVQGPKLVFSHILSPHPPYLFDSNGVIEGQTQLELDNHGFSDRPKFKEQTIYVNKRISELIQKIQTQSKGKAIIIIASDHGPASSLGRNDFKETELKKLDEQGVRERMGILNAYYFPDKNYEKLYGNITPVNTFRLILNQYFNEDLGLLPDKSYFSDNKDNQFRFMDVTTLLNN